jgi:hypothetical protein
MDATRRLDIVVGFALGIGMVSAACADAVTDWNAILVTTLVSEKTHAPMQSRNAALVHGAMFEAVNSLRGKYMPYLSRIPAASGTSAEAAAATAAHHALVALYPARADALDAALAQSLAAVPDGDGKQDGIAVGEQAAKLFLQARRDDGSGNAATYAQPATPTAYVPNPDIAPLAPHWGGVKPWLLDSASQFRPAGPPAVGSARFKRDLQEVRALGGKASTVRTPEQTDIARFWIPPGVPSWSPVARQLSAAARLDLADNARLFALLAMATADAITACWDAKYAYRYLRPETAIRSGLGSDPQATDPGWEPAVPTPPFPAYVSGHACFGGAAQTVLESVFGSDRLPTAVTLTSPTAPGVVRHYTRLADIVEEASNARIWGGIHWRTDQADGEELGRKVGKYAVGRVLLPAETIVDAKR